MHSEDRSHSGDYISRSRRSLQLSQDNERDREAAEHYSRRLEKNKNLTITETTQTTSSDSGSKTSEISQTSHMSNPDEDEGAEEHPPRRTIWLSGKRAFNVDPKRVPQDVITHLEELRNQEWEKRRDLRRQELCKVDRTDSSLDEKSKDRDVADAVDLNWKAIVPEEYLQYMMSESALEEEDKKWDEFWKAKEEKRKQEILAGKRSVRNMKMPDLSRCEDSVKHYWIEE